MQEPRGNLSEFEIIERFFTRRASAPAAHSGTRLGVGDDAALLTVPTGCELVAAIDTLVAGHHFLPDAAPRAIAHRALAVNLSDMAAMGATPAWALLALTLPQAESAWLGEFSAGWFELADRHGVDLVGGDTTRGPLTVSVQILGYVQQGTALRRSGGCEGDYIVVTGSLGDAGAGLALAAGRQVPGMPSAAVLTNPEAIAALRSRFEYPVPRLAFGREARGIASAAMDISDGLSGDLPKLAQASGLAAHVELERLPLSDALLSVATPVQAREWALSAGDDYELLMTVPRTRHERLRELAARLELRLTVIGELRAGHGVTWSMDGAVISDAGKGFDHFR